ncbi:MAG: hypothetical protein ACTH0V_05085 [Microbacteriaceae bacterium]
MTVDDQNPGPVGLLALVGGVLTLGIPLAAFSLLAAAAGGQFIGHPDVHVGWLCAAGLLASMGLVLLRLSWDPPDEAGGVLGAVARVFMRTSAGVFALLVAVWAVLGIPMLAAMLAGQFFGGPWLWQPFVMGVFPIAWVIGAVRIYRGAPRIGLP